MLGYSQYPWTEERIQRLSSALATVFLEEWGGPRSPLALQYLHETIIPNLVRCCSNNRDLLANETFLHIVDWKLRMQFGYPQSASNGLAKDLLQAAQTVCEIPQSSDPKLPWRRIFRLWLSGEPLPNIAERMGYPLDYLDLLQLRWKKVNKFVARRGISLLECLQHEELREFGWEQLSFLYQLHMASVNDALFKERLAMEQVIDELGLPLEIAELITILEVVHANEGKLDKGALSMAMRGMSLTTGPNGLHSGGRFNILPDILQGLLALHWLQENKAGKLTLSEKSARTIAGFLLPKLTEELTAVLANEDLDLAATVICGFNPEIQVRLVDWLVVGDNTHQTTELLSRIFKRVSRRVDLHILQAMGKLPSAFEFLVSCMEDKDSLVRAGVCRALGVSGNSDGVGQLLQRLADPVAEVRREAATALGGLSATIAEPQLMALANDYSEAMQVRASAEEALQRLKDRQI